MDNLKLGQIINEEQHKDAIHIAVAPVIAHEGLSPGQHIGFIGEEVGSTQFPIGIVDPFLKGQVKKGEKFWMYLYPGSITSLRHEWTHPDFPETATATPEATPAPAIPTESEIWLRDFADESDLSYEQLLGAANAYLSDGDYLIDGGKWESHSVPDKFWFHYERVTGTKVPYNDRGSFFSCFC